MKAKPYIPKTTSASSTAELSSIALSNKEHTITYVSPDMSNIPFSDSTKFFHPGHREANSNATTTLPNPNTSNIACYETPIASLNPGTSKIAFPNEHADPGSKSLVPGSRETPASKIRIFPKIQDTFDCLVVCDSPTQWYIGHRITSQNYANFGQQLNSTKGLQPISEPLCLSSRGCTWALSATFLLSMEPKCRTSTGCCVLPRIRRPLYGPTGV